MKRKAVLKDDTETSLPTRETAQPTSKHAKVMRLQRQLVDSFLKSGSKGAGSVRLLKAFRRMDSDASGDVSHDEIKSFLVGDNGLGLRLEDDVIDGVWEAMDSQAKGSVSFQDFMDVVQPVRELVDRESKGDSVVEDQQVETLEALGSASTPRLERTFWRVGTAEQKEGHRALVTVATKEGRIHAGARSRVPGASLSQEETKEAQERWELSMPASREKARSRLREMVSYRAGAVAPSESIEASEASAPGRLSLAAHPEENHHSAKHADAVGASNAHLRRVASQTISSQRRLGGDGNGPEGPSAATVSNLTHGEVQRQQQWQYNLQTQTAAVVGGEAAAKHMQVKRRQLAPPNARMRALGHSSEAFVPPPSREGDRRLLGASVMPANSTIVESEELPVQSRSLLAGSVGPQLGGDPSVSGSPRGLRDSVGRLAPLVFPPNSTSQAASETGLMQGAGTGTGALASAGGAGAAG